MTVAAAGDVGPPIPRWRVAMVSSASVVRSAATAGAALWATVVLGADDRGVMVLALTTAALLAATCGAGTGVALRSRLPTAGPEERARLASAYGRASAMGATVAAGAAVALLLAASPVIDDALRRPGLLAAAATSAFVQCLSAQGQDAWYAAGDFRNGSFIAAGAGLGGFAGLVVAGAAGATPATMLAGQAAGEGLVVALSLAALARRSLVRLGRGSGGDARRLVADGFPTLGASVGVLLIFRADRFVIGAVIGPAAVTVYSLAASLSEVSRTVPLAVGQVLVHDVAGGLGLDGIRRATLRAIGAVLASGVVITVVGWIAIPVVFDPEVHDARHYLVALVGAEVLFAPFFVASRGLMGGGWLRTIGAIGLGGCLFAVVAYVALVPPLGIAGACAASAVAYLLLSAVSVGALWRRHRGRAASGLVQDVHQ